MKKIIGSLLNGRSGAQEFLHKLATYPRFYKWMNEANGQDTITGGQREKRNNLFAKISSELNLASEALTYYEFGVHKGESIEWWFSNNDNADSVFFGFDSFEGLPEGWTKERGKGAFDVKGQVPQVDDRRVTFVPGWFHHTLPDHLGPLDRDQRRIFHMDADLYRSTIYPMMVFGPKVQVGDIIIFDEFADSVHEFRAFEDFCAVFNCEVDLIGATKGFTQSAFRVKNIG